MDTKCWYCGCKVIDQFPDRPMCEKCREKHDIALKELRKQYENLKAQVMVENAIHYIEAQRYRKVKMEDYKSSITRIANAAISGYAKFDSSSEVIAAIMLSYQKVRFVVQKSVGRRKVDIALPDQKIYVEIDGSTHKKRELEDNVRDVEILQKSPPGWEIVHITTAVTNKDFENFYAKVLEKVEAKRRYKKINNITIELEVAKAIEARQNHYLDQ